MKCKLLLAVLLLVGILFASCNGETSKADNETQKIEQIDSAATKLKQSATDLETKTKATEKEIDALLKDI